MTSSNYRSFCFVLLTFGLIGLLGCGENRGTSVNKTRIAKDPEEIRQESYTNLIQAQNADQIKVALAQLDNQGTKDRPKWTEADEQQLGKYFKLIPSDIEELSRLDFTPADTAYLDEYLYIRAAVKSLELEGFPKLDQAQEAIMWCSRMSILEKETKRGIGGVLPAVPAKLALQVGGGNIVTRANLWITALRTLGLTSCLIGPPSLDPVGKAGPGNMPSIRGVGLVWEKEIYVFEIESGKLMRGADGKTPLTLKQIRATETPLKGWETLAPKVEELKTWTPHVILPLSGVSSRMKWLQTQIGSNHKLNFALDAKAYFESFSTELPAKSWDNPQDALHLTRLQLTFAYKSGRGGLQDFLRRSYFPLHLLKIDFEKIPETVALGIESVLRGGYQERFDPLRFDSSPRDLMVQGKFQEATAALGDIKGRADRDRQRAETQPVKLEDFLKILEELQKLSAQITRAENDGDQVELARAKQKNDEFRKDSRRYDTYSSYIGGETSQAVAAEAAFVLAQLAHEKAIRYEMRTNDPKQAQISWQNARESWKRYLENYPKVKGKFPDMERHAQKMMATAEEMLKK